MSKVNQGVPAAARSVNGVPDALVAPMGPQVLDVIEIAYRARLPVLVEGPTGVGKSQIVAEFARRAQIGFAVLDLSLLEPPDLVGLPVIRDGRTHYAPPSELPQGGAGILMLEELNRAEIPVMQPALQLLSARKLHSYELPPGWSCVAAVNPEDGDYQVHHLDPALRSRFLQLNVRADTASWLPWARQHNVHPAILQTVQAHADAFDQASPRSWTYASEALHAMGPAERARPDLVRLALRGYLPTAWTLRLVEQLAGLPALPELDLDALFTAGGASVLAAATRQPTQAGRTDELTLLAAVVRRALQGPRFEIAVRSGTVTLESLEKTFAALPGDLRDQCLDQAVAAPIAVGLLAGLGVEGNAIADGYRGSPLQRKVAEWRDRMQLHRVRLAVNAARLWLERNNADPAAVRRAAPHLRALVTDAALLGQDLGLALRARLPDGELA
ncbi:MAG TPA: AAA family ATPase [Planctomycetota bacterium]